MQVQWVGRSAGLGEVGSAWVALPSLQTRLLPPYSEYCTVEYVY